MARACANIALVRSGRGSQQPYVDPGLIPNDRKSLSGQVNQWLLTRLAEPYDLQRLASAFHVSTRTLLRRYKSETGASPLAWLQQSRVEKAKHLLQSSALSLGQIVDRVGYGDVATFSRLFLRLAGESPARYRRHSRPAPA
ncbi:helix-turn-helix domain-containing protein [Piscinibacter sp.]|uniref:helix-turn-helix domain-containing protein n=1 Tax=Piscinibacter sp. TaxID=1903157 RepID=UPI002C3E62C8|nr:helix-turn-helix domain-containing protein [Albitalea sp.]HUG25940.1 helix-turn-helix domain-containing protein [Albitalea sp.]